MAGYTGFSVGLVNNQCVYLPIPQLVATSPRSMDPYGLMWEKVLAMTGQPNTVPPKKDKKDQDATSTADHLQLPEPSVF